MFKSEKVSNDQSDVLSDVPEKGPRAPVQCNHAYKLPNQIMASKPYKNKECSAQ